MSAALVSVLASIAAAAPPITKRRRENVFGSRDGLRMVILPSLEFQFDRALHWSSVPALGKPIGRDGQQQGCRHQYKGHRRAERPVGKSRELVVDGGPHHLESRAAEKDGRGVG